MERSVQELLLAVVDAACIVRDIDYGIPAPKLERLDAAVDAYRLATGQAKSGRPKKPAPPDAIKECSKCHSRLPVGDFPIAKAKGRLFRRSWCPECLKAYYKTVAQERKAGLRQ